MHYTLRIKLKVNHKAVIVRRMAIALEKIEAGCLFFIENQADGTDRTLAWVCEYCGRRAKTNPCAHGIEYEMDGLVQGFW